MDKIIKLRINGRSLKLKNKRVSVGTDQFGNKYLTFKKLIKNEDLETQIKHPTCNMEINRNIITTTIQLSPEVAQALTQLLNEQQ